VQSRVSPVRPCYLNRAPLLSPIRSIVLAQRVFSLGETVLENLPVNLRQSCTMRVDEFRIIKNTLELNLGLMCTMFTLCIKKCPFIRHRSAVLEIRDGAARLNVYFKFSISADNWQRSRSSFATIVEKQSSARLAPLMLLPFTLHVITI